MDGVRVYHQLKIIFSSHFTSKSIAWIGRSIKLILERCRRYKQRHRKQLSFRKNTLHHLNWSKGLFKSTTCTKEFEKESFLSMPDRPHYLTPKNYIIFHNRQTVFFFISQFVLCIYHFHDKSSDLLKNPCTINVYSHQRYLNITRAVDHHNHK